MEHGCRTDAAEAWPNAPASSRLLPPNISSKYEGPLLLQDHLASVVDNAHQRLLYRHIKTDEMRHLIAPSSMLEAKLTSIHSSS
jgi:hypothetical protein